jgi:succinylglutamate desuccinylase
MFPESIIKKEGALPGKTLAVFAGIHGNEKAGVHALQNIIPTIQIDSGTVYFVFANPPAIEKDTRYINKNLNRLFSRDVRGDEYEVSRAHELMDILDQCDALLDLHSYNSPTGDPFAITEANGFEFVSKIDVPIVASGFGDMGYGTDDYMYRNGKIGICLECGTSNNYEHFTPYAEKAVRQFLAHFGVIEDVITSPSPITQTFVTVKKLIKKQTEQFSFSKDFKDFELLPTDSPFITDGDTEVYAEENEVILFPRADVPVGEEVCIIGEFVRNSK